MTLCFASHNENKVKEIAAILPDGITVISLHAVGYHDEIPETGKTLQENAYIKAKAVFDATGMPSFADDTGLEVSALNGAPGVYSARYAGAHKNSEDNIQLLLSNLKGISDRSAQFRTVICFIDTTSKAHYFEGIVSGEIIDQKLGESGFGYDPIFRPTGHANTFAEMTMEEKNKISHRKIAFSKLAIHLTTT